MVKWKHLKKQWWKTVRVKKVGEMNKCNQQWVVQWKHLKKQRWKSLRGSPKKQEFLKLGARKFCFPNYKKFFQSEFFFIFWTRKVTSWNIRSFFGFLFPEIQESYVSWNRRNFFEVSIFRNIRKAFFWENLRNFLILELKSFISQTIRKYKNFFFIFRAIFAKRSIVDVCHRSCSEYASGSEYTRVPNMTGFWIYLSRNIIKPFFKKI